MAVLAERILLHLAEHGPCFTRQLASCLGASSKGIVYACRCLRRHGLLHSEDSLHGLTAAGMQTARDGGWIPCQRVGRAATSDGRTLRQRAWAVLRMADHTTVPDILRVVCDGDDRARRRTCAITAARSTLRASWARRGARARIFCGVRLIRAPTPRPTTAPARR